MPAQISEEDIATRVQSILDELGVSARELARRAGFKSEAHVGLIVARKVKRPSADTLQAIARVGGVELDWLTGGRGPRRRPETVIEKPERYHHMPLVRQIARAEGIPEAFVASWEAKLDYDGQPGVDALWTILRGVYEESKHRRRASDAPLEGIDDVQPPRKKR